MNLLNEKFKVILEEDKGKEKNLFWTYNLTNRDFFLKSTDNWKVLTTESYIVNINGNFIELPVNYYIIIGDYDGGLDTIRLFEIVGRPFEAFVLGSTLEREAWSLESLSIVGYKETSNFIIPEIKTPYIISISDKKCVIISDKEIYNKLKHLTFSDIL